VCWAIGVCIPSFNVKKSFTSVSFIFKNIKSLIMKSLIIYCLAMFVSIAAFSQKAKQNSDTTLKSYLTYSCSMHPQYVSNVPAKCPVCNRDLILSKKEQMKAEVVKLYTCPMDKVISTQPGKCPKCGKDMVEFKPKKKSGNN
jgi:hypothetical protein